MKTEEINSHQVFKTIIEIKNRLSQEDVNQINIEDREFILDSLSYIESRIKNSIYSLVNVNTLNQIQNECQIVRDNINNFFTNKNYGHINNSKVNLNNALSIIHQIPISIPNKTEELSDIVNNFKLNIKSEEQSIKKDIEKLNNSINSITNQIDNTNQNLKNAQDQINQLITNFQNDYNQLKQKIINDSEDVKNNMTQQSEVLFTQLNTKLEEAKKIVNVIGNIGVTENYLRNAEYHRKQANLWRWISIGFMTVSIIYLSITVYHIGQYEWHISLLRILSTILFIYPAQYAAGQSSKHREQEIYNKKMELDLTAINPFIELFDEKKKQELKEKLVDKYFNNNIYTNKSDPEIPVTIYDKIVGQVLNIIKSIKQL
ncbi:MAG: hypothetical protein IRZ03_15780 [Acidobacterium ailaaui]|nr:hypothetical protein [Pseudacidobacterium ailaaui]